MGARIKRNGGRERGGGLRRAQWPTCSERQRAPSSCSISGSSQFHLQLQEVCGELLSRLSGFSHPSRALQELDTNDIRCPLAQAVFAESRNSDPPSLGLGARESRVGNRNRARNGRL